MRYTRLEFVLTTIIAVILVWYVPAQLIYRFRNPKQTETEILLHTKDVLLFR